METKQKQSQPRYYLTSTPQKIRLQQKGTLRRLRHTQGIPTHIQLNFDNYSYLLTEEIYNRNGRKAKF